MGEDTTIDTTHSEIARAMLETVKLERACIETLDLDGMMRRARQREHLAEQAIVLARRMPAPESAKQDYRIAHLLATQNRDILRSAQNTVSTMLNQIMGRHSPTYSARGKSYAARSLRTSVVAWTG